MVKLREGGTEERTGAIRLPTKSFGINSVVFSKPPPDSDGAFTQRFLDVAAQFSRAVSFNGSIAANERVTFQWGTVNWEREEERGGVFELVSTGASRH